MARTSSMPTTASSVGRAGSPTPRNPCGDPPGGTGTTLTAPTAEGGSLRSQDLRTTGDPVGLDGSVIRIDPDTGLGWPTNAHGRIVGRQRAADHRLRAPQPVPDDGPAGDEGGLDRRRRQHQLGRGGSADRPVGGSAQLRLAVLGGARDAAGVHGDRPEPVQLAAGAARSRCRTSRTSTTSRSPPTTAAGPAARRSPVLRSCPTRAATPIRTTAPCSSPTTPVAASG